MSEPKDTPGGFTILVTEPHSHSSLEILRSIGNVRLGPADRRYTEEELAKAIGDCDAVLITSRDSISKVVIEHAPRLKVICKYGARPEKVDLEAAAERGIRVLSTPLSNPESVAEHVILLILAIHRRLCALSSGLKAGQWRSSARLGTELAGKTVGLVGLGNVGGRLAEKLAGFKVKIVAYDPWVHADKAAGLGVELTDLETVLRSSDVVSLHAAVTKESAGMMGEAQLRTMKSSAYLINTARGALVDEAALVRALREGWIAGAGIDVFDDEPVPASHPLLHLENVIATPHIAAFTEEALDREFTWAAEDVKRVLLGQEPIHS